MEVALKYHLALLVMLLLGPINENWSFFPTVSCTDFFLNFSWQIFLASILCLSDCSSFLPCFPTSVFLPIVSYAFFPDALKQSPLSSFTGLPDCQHDPRNYHFEEKVTTQLRVLYVDVIFQVTSVDWAPFFFHSGWKAALAHQPFPEFFLSESWVMMTFLRQLSSQWLFLWLPVGPDSSCYHWIFIALSTYESSWHEIYCAVWSPLATCDSTCGLTFSKWNKRKYFLTFTRHILNAKLPHVASGYHTGECGCGAFPGSGHGRSVGCPRRCFVVYFYSWHSWG